LGEVLGRVPMQFFVREHCTMIAAPIQCDVDGIPQGSHCVSVSESGDVVARAALAAFQARPGG
jgi:hypothetical protein